MQKVNSMKAVRSEDRGLTNLWIFESNKGAGRFSITTDISFAMFILLEGDTRIKSYEPYPDISKYIPANCKKLKPTALAKQHDGKKIFLQCSYEPEKLADHLMAYKTFVSSHPDAIGYEVICSDEIWKQKIFIENWIFLSAAINRSKRFGRFHEMRVIKKMILTDGVALRLEELLAAPDVDDALMLGAVAWLLQQGTLKSDLTSQIFGYTSIIEGNENDEDKN